MIERVVLIELRAELCEAQALAAIVAQTRQVLSPIPEVLALRVGLAADERTRRAYTLCIEVRCEDLEAVERYRAHPAHRAYVDVFLRPMLGSIRVYNFEVDTT